MENLLFLKISFVLLLLFVDSINGICWESACELASNDFTKCCKNDRCCSEWEYSSEQVVNAFKLGVGAIIGIAIGGIVLIIICIIGCVCCCCRPGQTRQGAVIANTSTVHAQPVTMHQYPPPGAQYPPGGYPAGSQYPPQYASQPAYNPASPGGVAPYPAKDPNMAQAGFSNQPPPY
uniref:uncharacterized protein LOC120333999 n=1 Tax=Styela clava TaxID=7725 RepID=UPI0019393580|nr:uncharacterized protein LOC120333999 [Styela clava]